MQRGRLVVTLLRGVRDVDAVRAFSATTKKTTAKETPEPKTRKLSGYMLFLKDTSAKLRNTGLPVSEISKQVSKQWAETSAVQRQKYIDEAMRLNEASKDETKKAAKETKKEKIKRPGNVYADFMKSVFPSVQRQYPDKTFAEKSRIVSAMWKNMTDEEKEQRKKALALSQSSKM